MSPVTWVPDAFLVGKGYFDESKSLPYNPTDYPGHGTGLFVVGVEGTGMLHVFAMNHTSGAATKIATFTSGNPGSMGIEIPAGTGPASSTRLMQPERQLALGLAEYFWASRPPSRIVI